MKNNDPFWEYCNDVVVVAVFLLCLVETVSYIKICFLIVLFISYYKGNRFCCWLFFVVEKRNTRTQKSRKLKGQI